MRDHGWSKGQVVLFAREFAQSAEARAWWAFVDDVREALLTEFVMLKASGNERGVTLADAFVLEMRVGAKVRTESGKVLTVTAIHSGMFNLPWGQAAMTLAAVEEETGFYDVRRITVVA